MRKVLKSGSEVIHFFANQVQSEGSSGNLFFETHSRLGLVLYSYGYHFSIARHVPGAVVITNARNSNTTNGHINDTRYACNHLKRVYCVTPTASAAENKVATTSRIENKLKEAKTERRIQQKTRDALNAEALRLATEFNAYLAALPKDERKGVKPFALDGMDKLLAAKERADKKADKARAAELVRRAKEQQNRIYAAAEQLQEWREGAKLGALPYINYLPTALRIKGDNIETSRGADIPLKVAPALWAMIQENIKHGQDSDFNLPVGHYRLNMIRADGSIVVGCHDISYKELSLIAKQLELI